MHNQENKPDKFQKEKSKVISFMNRVARLLDKSRDMEKRSSTTTAQKGRSSLPIWVCFKKTSLVEC
jgi:hypothetical protein